MADWSFLTNHARVLLCIATTRACGCATSRSGRPSPGRTAHSIVTEAGYVVKEKDGRRNRYQIQAHLPLPQTGSRNAPPARSWRS